MSEPFLGEIKMFAGNFAPLGWAFCDGQLIAKSQHNSLFSLFGTIYGGDGRSTFGLPDLRGRIPICAGRGGGLEPRKLGERSGVERVTLTKRELPPHSHDVCVFTKVADKSKGWNNLLGKLDSSKLLYTADIEEKLYDADKLNIATISSTGGGQSHNNIMPSICINYIVALKGLYPSRP